MADDTAANCLGIMEKNRGRYVQGGLVRVGLTREQVRRMTGQKPKYAVPKSEQKPRERQETMKDEWQEIVPRAYSPNAAAKYSPKTGTIVITQKGLRDIEAGPGVSLKKAMGVKVEVNRKRRSFRLRLAKSGLKLRAINKTTTSLAVRSIAMKGLLPDTVMLEVGASSYKGVVMLQPVSE